MRPPGPAPFTAAKSTPRCSATRRASGVAFTRAPGPDTVDDACGGIPADEIDRLFDLGYRGDGARTPGTDGGAGLGLAIAKGFVEAHRGRIEVRNVGAGCRFTVHLPAQADA